MYCEYTVYARIYDPNPEAARLGCSHSHYEKVIADSLAMVKTIYLKKYPTAKIQRITCAALDLDINMT